VSPENHTLGELVRNSFVGLDLNRNPLGQRPFTSHKPFDR